jgi:hypothetical protein
MSERKWLPVTPEDAARCEELRECWGESVFMRYQPHAPILRSTIYKSAHVAMQQMPIGATVFKRKKLRLRNEYEWQQQEVK